MRWSSSSCRMLLQMSLNSFSTCARNHAAGQTGKIRLRERPRRRAEPVRRSAGSPGRANARMRGAGVLSVPLSGSSPGCGVQPVLLCRRAAPAVSAAFGGRSSLHIAAPRLCASAAAGSSQGRSPSHASWPARRVLAPAGRRCMASAVGHARDEARGQQKCQPALNRRRGPGGRGTGAERSTTILETNDSAGRAHTSWRYFLIRLTCSSLPLESSFCSMEEMILHEARRAPMTFL